MTDTLATRLDELPSGADALDALDAFTGWMRQIRNLTLYPAQDEALTAVALGSHVVLATPTGSGKSLVAAGAQFLALHAGRKTVYTAPIKALVSEKFFDLVDLFGAENVGMVTGDSAINPDAPIVCCTAEILANLALRDARAGGVTQVVMDEFHYYADPDRGWAWQVPLLLMRETQFVLMSATLGDVTEIARDLSDRTGRDTEVVTGAERPVPLSFSYAETPVHETIEELRDAGQLPVYLVHFNQVQAVERAQALTSVQLTTREQRDAIADAVAGFRFARGFGQTLARYLKLGIGVHHAGMLPKYRRLVEQLAQRGLLAVICGTDTLGVGINVPIRTVLFTQLTKYDGVRMRRLQAREFHQIAGRAGRAGFDTVGSVVAQAPDHDIENRRAEQKAASKPGKKKAVKKQPPAGFVGWNRATLERLIATEPEPLVSRMRVTHAMVLSVIARGETRPGQSLAVLRELIFDSHEPRSRRYQLARRALEIFRTLRRAGIVERVPADGGPLLRVTVELQRDFALNQPLSPFALAALELCDPDSPDYPLDVISVIEATLEDPRAILRAQEHAARGEAIAEMKADGIEYDERMERLEEITYPQPLGELLTEAFERYVAEVPWARDYAISPKSVVRTMIERACSFRDFVNLYDLGRVEGVVLRYLSDAYRALARTVPAAARTEQLSAYIAWLGETVRQVDSSLLDEWAQLALPGADRTVPGSADRVSADSAGDDLAAPGRAGGDARLTDNRSAFHIMLRNALFQVVQAAAQERLDRAAELSGAGGLSQRDWRAALDAYFAEYDRIGIGADARNPGLLELDTSGGRMWRFRQVLDDPRGDRDWAITGTVDLDASDAAGEPVLRVEAVGPHEPAGSVAPARDAAEPAAH